MGAAAKRKARSGETTFRRTHRLHGAREYKKRRRLLGDLATTAGSYNDAVPSAWMERMAETQTRNEWNQRSVVLKKADEKKVKAKARSRHNTSSQTLDRERFFAAIDEPINLICGSCGELRTPKKMTVIEIDKKNAIFQTLATPRRLLSPDGLVPEAIVTRGRKRYVPFCDTCLASLRLKKTPKFCAASGFALSPVPSPLAVLNSVESRLIGLGVCFTSCYNLPGDGQESTRGNAINFWNDAYKVVNSLPRPISKCGIVRIRCKGDADPTRLFEVRPNLVRKALLWLLENNPLYRDVTISESALAELDPDNTSSALATITVESEPPSPGEATGTAGPPRSSTEAHGGIESVSEVDELFHLDTGQGGDQTEQDKILQSINVTIDGLTTPINEYTTRTMMQACFPTLFPDGKGGIHPIDGEDRMHSYELAAYCAHLMAWHDRRFVMHRNFKFLCLNLIQRRQIDGLTRKMNPKSLDEADDCGQGKHSKEDRAKRILKELKPYFRVVRGSGLYWSDVRDDLIAMIGNDALPERFPTFFFTLSAADTIWPDFFCACNPALSMEEAMNLSSQERRKYLNQNADIASRHFHRRFKSFFDNIICGDAQPLGEVVDFFWRVEFQKRGSPHIHGLLWIRDAPNVLELSASEEGRQRLEAFVDGFISADSLPTRATSDCSCSVCTKMESSQMDILSVRPPGSDTDESLCDTARLVRRVQQHVCFANSKCREKKGSCRFDYPKPLRTSTAVTVEKANNGALKVQVECRRSDPVTNNYNPALLCAWRANMDIKLVGNAYGAAEYTAAYVSKAEPDTTKFRDLICRALDKCTSTSEHHEVLRRVGNATLAAREVSAQEALWILQNGLPMYGKSRNILKVKTTRHSRRHYRVDPATCRKEIESATPSTEDSVRIDPLEAAYMARPPELDTMNYRSFLQNYECSRDAPSDTQQLRRWTRLDGKGYIKERRVAQAITPCPRWKADPENPDYCYSEVMLRTPWRHLSELPEDDDDCTIALQKLRESDKHRASLTSSIGREHNLQLLTQAREESSIRLPVPEWTLNTDSDQVRLDSDIYNRSPTASTDSKRNPVPIQNYSADDVSKAQTFISNVVKPFMKQRRQGSDGASTNGRRQSKLYQYPIGLSENNMDSDQWNAFAACMHQSRARYAASQQGTTCKPLTMILNGAGGCGKSWLIRHIVKDVHHVFGDHNLSTRRSKRVLLMAHHGTAAFNIKGSTICSALSIPQMKRTGYEVPYESLKETRSGTNKLRNLQEQYASVHLVVIDEYSVISCAMLHWMDQRMREIWPAFRHLPFGGRDVILAGDLGQLSPVNPAPLSTPSDELKNSNQKQGRALWEKMTKVCNLTTQNRGRLDPDWYAALARLRRMEQTTEDMELFNSRYSTNISCTDKTKFISYKNDDVDHANTTFLNRQAKPVYDLHATHTVEPIQADCEVTPRIQQAIADVLVQAKVPNRKRDKTIPPFLAVAIGAPVSITVNLEQSAGLCNGTKAIVHDFILTPGGGTPIVLVEITDKYLGPSFLPSTPNIVPIAPYSQSWTIRGVNLRTRRTGLPLRLAYAMTIHKVQGLTCDSVVFDPTNIPTSAFAYVGLSRVRRRTDVSLWRLIKLSQTSVQSKTKQQLTKEWARLDEEDTRGRAADENKVCHYQKVAEMANTSSASRMTCSYVDQPMRPTLLSDSTMFQ